MKGSSTLLMAFACGALFCQNVSGKYLLVEVEENDVGKSQGNFSQNAQGQLLALLIIALMNYNLIINLYQLQILLNGALIIN